MVFSLIISDTEDISPTEAPKRVAAVGATMVALGMAEVREVQVVGSLKTVPDFW